MKLRKREVVWLLALGALLLAVRGMDARTSNLRQRGRAADEQAATAALPPPGTAVGAVPAGDGGAAAGDGSASITMTAAELGALAWGPNPFHAAPSDVMKRAVAHGAAEAPAEAPAPPRFQGVVRVRGRLLAALDGAFRAPGERVGEWRVEEIVPDAVTIRHVRSGETRRLVRGRAALAP